MKTDNIRITMEDGRIMEAELYSGVAPGTVANFKALIKLKFYNGLIFHRVIKGFMIQTGDPTGTGRGGSRNRIIGEFKANGVHNDIKHERGVLSMARANDPNSASSQFFILQEDSPHLDGYYAAFGRITKGIEVVDEIASVPTNILDKPKKKQRIKTIELIDE